MEGVDPNRGVPGSSFPHNRSDCLRMIFSEFTKLFKMFLRTIRGLDSPRQMAFGLAIGMLIGLIPKDSLFVYFFGLTLLFTTANLFWAAVGGFIFTWVGHFLSPVLHQIGAVILTFDTLEPTWAYLIEQPIVPWTRFDHTIVMGSLFAGLVAFWPTYQISKSLFEAYAPRFSRRLKRTRIYQWVVEPISAPATKNSA